MFLYIPCHSDQLFVKMSIYGGIDRGGGGCNETGLSKPVIETRPSQTGPVVKPDV